MKAAINKCAMWLFLFVVVGLAYACRFACSYYWRTTTRHLVTLWKPPEGEHWSRGRFFVALVNPNAGGGKGEEVFVEVVRPMLRRAGIEFHVVFTRSATCARDVCSQLAQASFCVDGKAVDCVLCVSGDGMLHEAINGCSHGGTWRDAFQRVVFAVVPVGTANGVSDSLYGRHTDVVTAMDEVINGTPQPIDVMTLRRAGSNVEQLDVHFFCWAAFADHDYMTEHPMRRLGPRLKLMLAPLVVLARKRVYHGTIDLLPVLLSKEERVAGCYSDPSELPASPADHAMKRLQGPMFAMAIGNLSEGGGANSPTPFAKQAEGAVDILFCRAAPGITRWRLGRLLSLMEHGKHVHEPELQFFKASRVAVYPAGTRGHMQLSGQEIGVGDVQIAVAPSAARMLHRAR